MAKKKAVKAAKQPAKKGTRKTAAKRPAARRAAAKRPSKRVAARRPPKRPEAKKAAMAKPKAAKAPKAPAAAADPTPYGTFVWHELMTGDVEAAKRFYGETLGHRAEPAPTHPGYEMLYAGGEGIGGYMKLDKAPPHWLPYVAVKDVDATVERAQSLGATVRVPPTDIPQVGRFAVLGDPTGASFALYQSNKPYPPRAEVKNGQVAWNDLVTSDIDAAKAFYTQLFGWGLDSMDMGPLGKYWLFTLGEKQVGGAMAYPPGESAPPMWMTHFQVADCDEAVSKAQSLGARVLKPADDIPNVGRSAALADPSGATFGVYTPAPRA